MNEIASDREKESSEDSESALQWEKFVRSDIACLLITQRVVASRKYDSTLHQHSTATPTGPKRKFFTQML